MAGNPAIKPAHWAYDGFEHLRYSLFANAEFLGIDPASLQAVLPFIDRRAVDVISGGLCSAAGAPVWRGDGYAFEATGDYLTTPFVKGVGGTDLRYTAVFAYRNTVAFAGASLYPTFYSFGGDYRDSFYIQDTDVEGFSLYFGSIVNTRTSPVRTAYEDGENHMLATAVDAVSDIDQIWVDGNKQQTAKARSQTSYASSTTNYLEIGCRSGDPTDKCRGVIPFFYLFNDVLPDAITARLHAAPYELIQPVSRPLIFDFGGGTPAGNAVFTGNAAFSSIGYKVGKGSTNVAGISALIATGYKKGYGSTTISGISAATLAGYKKALGDLVVTGISDFVATGYKVSAIPTGSALFVGNAAFAATGYKKAVNQIAVAGSASFNSSGFKQALGNALYSGNAVVIFTGRSLSSSSASEAILTIELLQGQLVVKKLNSSLKTESLLNGSITLDILDG